MNSTVEAIQALTAAVGGETPEKVLQTVDALKQLCVAMGGDVANVADISTIPDAVGKLATAAGEMADSVGMFIDVIEGDIVNLKIPEGVTTIGSYAFSSCTNLASVTIPDGVTTIGGNAFSNCTNLASVTIPEGVTTIGDGAFSNCTNLASVTIPDGVTTIGSYAFSNMPTDSHIYCGFSEGDVSGAPWGATNATIVYDYTPT